MLVVNSSVRSHDPEVWDIIKLQVLLKQFCVLLLFMVIFEIPSSNRKNFGF